MGVFNKIYIYLMHSKSVLAETCLSLSLTTKPAQWNVSRGTSHRSRASGEPDNCYRARETASLRNLNPNLCYEKQRKLHWISKLLKYAWTDIPGEPKLFNEAGPHTHTGLAHLRLPWLKHHARMKCITRDFKTGDLDITYIPSSAFTLASKGLGH